MATTDAVTVTIRVPAPLRPSVGGLPELRAEGRTAGEALRDLARRHPEVQARLFDGNGGLRPFVNVYLGERSLRALGGLAAPLSAGDVLVIVPAVAGGRRRP